MFFYLQADFFVLFCFFSDWNLRSSLACGAKVKQHQGAFFSRLFLVDDAAAIICFLPAGSPSKSIYGSLCASCRIPLRAEQKWKPRWLGSGLLRASLAVHFSRSKYVRNTRPRRREDERVPYGTFGTKERISRHFLFCFFQTTFFLKAFSDRRQSPFFSCGYQRIEVIMYAIWKEGTVLVHWPLEHYLWWRKCLFWLYVRRFHVPRRFECDSAFQTIRNGHLFLKNKKILRMEKRRSNRMAINGSDEHSKNLAQKKKHDHLNARVDWPYMSMPQSNHFFFLL